MTKIRTSRVNQRFTKQNPNKIQCFQIGWWFPWYPWVATWGTRSFRSLRNSTPSNPSRPCCSKYWATSRLLIPVTLGIHRFGSGRHTEKDQFEAGWWSFLANRGPYQQFLEDCINWQLLPNGSMMIYVSSTAAHAYVCANLCNMTKLLSILAKAPESIRAWYLGLWLAAPDVKDKPKPWLSPYVPYINFSHKTKTISNIMYQHVCIFIYMHIYIYILNLSLLSQIISYIYIYDKEWIRSDKIYR